MFLFDKIKSKYFCLVKMQKEKHHSKNSLYYTERNSSFVDVFSEKFTNYFHAKEKSSPYRQGLSISFYNLDI